MSLLVNANGRPKTYVVVNTRTRTVVAAFNWVGEAMKAVTRDGAVDLTLHNITHPKCPDWLKELVRSDRVYCSRKAEDLDANAAALRRKATDLVAQAEEYERRAAEWRDPF